MCYTCYYLPGVREKYKIISKYHDHVSERPASRTKLALLPTSALPGTDEKIEVMKQRAFDGVSVFHPKDGYYHD